MSEHGNAGLDRREGAGGGRRGYDLPAPHGSDRYWRERKATAERMIAEGGDSARLGRASLRQIASAMRRRGKS